MAASINQDFITYAGDDVKPIFTVKDSAGAIVDISTVSAITWNARRTEGDVVLTKTKAAGQITFVTDGTDGKFQVALAAADTTALSGFYVHEAKIADGGGLTTTVTVGRMQVGLTPVWTYDPGQLATSSLYQVRDIIGDTLAGEQQLTDSEVNYALSLYSNTYLAAAECARKIAARYSRLVDTVQGELRTMYSSRAARYSAMARELEQRGVLRSGGGGAYTGGISVSDKQNRVADSDRVAPQFNIGMFDDNLFGKTGHETDASTSAEEDNVT